MREILSRLVACGWNESIGDCFGRGYTNVGDDDKKEKKKRKGVGKIRGTEEMVGKIGGGKRDTEREIISEACSERRRKL